MTFLLIITILQSLTCLGAAVYYLTRNSTTRKEFVFLGAHTIGSTLSELIQYILVFVVRVSANPLLHTYSFIDIAVTCLLYRVALKHVLKPIVSDVVMAGLLIFALVNSLAIQGVDSINSYTSVSHAIVMIVYSLIYYYSLLKSLPTADVRTLPMFWINNGMFLYFTGNFFVWIFTDYMVNVLKSDLVSPWTFHNFLGIIRNIFFVVGLWLAHRSHRLA